MTFQVILDSRFRGNDNCFVSFGRGRMSACMLLLLTAIVMLSWTTTLADSTDQSSAPGGEAVQQAESTPVSTSDSEMVNLYKTLLEDQRNITDKILANQQTFFVIALSTATLVWMALLAVAGWLSFKQFKQLVENARADFARELDEELQRLKSESDKKIRSATDYLSKRSEILTSASIHLTEANTGGSHWKLLSKEERRSELGILGRAVDSAILALGTILQIPDNRTDSPVYYLVRSSLAAVHEIAKVVPATQVKESQRHLLNKKLEIVTNDSELWLNKEIRDWVEGISWWLSHPDKTLGDRKLENV